MWLARWEYIWVDYIQVDKLEDCGFPMIKLSDNSNKWLKVELYNVPVEWIEWPLDSLEWYTPNCDYNLYNRVKIETKEWRSIWVYEIARDINDELEKHFYHTKWGELFYDWK
jgi:hypothetical protein